jgi:DNA-binding MarR family transcriptional regulator
LRRVRDDTLAVWLRLLAAHRRVSAACGEALAPFQLGLPEYEVLLQTARAGAAGLRMQELARRVFLTESGVTRLVTRLEGHGWLTRRPAPADQRGRLCEVTPPGLERLRAARPHFLRALEGALGGRAGLTGAELAALGCLLGKLASTADADEHASRAWGGATDSGATALRGAAPARARR